MATNTSSSCNTKSFDPIICARGLETKPVFVLSGFEDPTPAYAAGANLLFAGREIWKIFVQKSRRMRTVEDRTTEEHETAPVNGFVKGTFSFVRLLLNLFLKYPFRVRAQADPQELTIPAQK